MINSGQKLFARRFVSVLARGTRSERRHRLVRALISTRDMVRYCYYTLATNFWSWAIVSVVLLAFYLLFPRDLGVLPPSLGGRLGAALLVSVVLLGLRSLLRRLSGGDRPIEIRTDRGIVSALKKISPSDIEIRDGFVVYNSDIAPQGPIVASEHFNRDCMANPNWDAELILLDNYTYARIIDDLKAHSSVLKKYLWKKYKASIFSPNPLTNDPKIGFRSPIISNLRNIEIYETDYFSGLCTADLTTDDIVSISSEGNIELKQKAFYPFNKSADGTIQQLDFNDTSKPRSLHGGVEMIAISQDYYLRLAIQSKYAQVSGGMRAPLASGSMDWEDQEGCKTLKQLILKAAHGELVEEWGRKHPRKPPLRITEIQPIGYFRMPHRGSKPQFVVFAKLENLDQDLRPDLAEVEADLRESAGARFHVSTFDKLRSATEQMLHEGGIYQNSVPLFGALVCLEHAIRLFPRVICDVARYDNPT
jgi:hypothetical protein